MNKTGTWTGKNPEGCHAKTMVTDSSNGILVTAWIMDREETEWVMTSLTVMMGYSEVSSPKALASGGKEIMERAERLGKCLIPVVKQNNPMDCRYSSYKEYSAGEEMGIERHWKIWLDDDGRKSVLNYIIGNTETLPFPDADLNPVNSLPPGTDLHLHFR